MATGFFASDGATYRRAAKLWVWDGSAWQQVKKGFVYDGGAWRLTYDAATLSGVSASRDACTSTAGHIIVWTASGDLTGWTIRIIRTINGVPSTVATGVDPTLGTYAVPYASGNAQTETGFTLHLEHGSLEAFGSPATVGPPINPC